MAYKTIFFDLDGTLTDSGEGIMNCATLALERLGLPVPDRDALRVFVGPPLRETFLKFGVPEDQIEKAVQIYRSRYRTVGKFENFPYPGIRELLSDLSADGCRLFVATSKPETMAVEILTKFELSDYFERICGATMDGSRDSKEAVLAYLLNKIGSVSDVVMVGDTAYDVIGAAAHGIPTIGVTWGYGTREAMESAGAARIAASPSELYQFLTPGSN